MAKRQSSPLISTEIKGEEGKTFKEDVKRAKISVEGADVEITNVVFHWRSGKNETISNVGVVKAGGETAAKDAPAREATLMSVSVQYKILNNKPTATVKVWDTTKRGVSTGQQTCSRDQCERRRRSRFTPAGVRASLRHPVLPHRCEVCEASPQPMTVFGIKPIVV